MSMESLPKEELISRGQEIRSFLGSLARSEGSLTPREILKGMEPEIAHSLIARTSYSQDPNFCIEVALDYFFVSRFIDIDPQDSRRIILTEQGRTRYQLMQEHQVEQIPSNIVLGEN